MSLTTDQINAIIEARITAAETECSTLLESAQTYGSDAVTASSGYFTTGTVADIVKPNLTITNFVPNQDLGALFKQEYNNQLGALQNAFGPMFANIMATYFPQINGQLTTDMENWLDNMIVNGGIGLPLTVEQAIWQRARDREVEHSMTVKDQAINEWAARGFSLPPGALANRAQIADIEASKKISEVNREVMIEQAKMQVETVKFAVAEAVKLRMNAFDSVLKYVETYSRLGMIAGEMAAAEIAAMKDLWMASAEYYRSLVAVENLKAEVAHYNQDKSIKLQSLDLESWKTSYQGKITVADSVAKMFAQTASAYLNAQNTMVQMYPNA